MTTTQIDWEDGAFKATAIGGMAAPGGPVVYVRLAAVELLMREYHWTPDAAGRFADRLVADAAGAAERAARMRETLDERRARRVERIETEREQG